jgi:KaiC/GvpD/RAD55 family RecA-like ATPase
LTRPRLTLMVIILLATILPSTSVSAQTTNPVYVALYAHTTNNARILNAVPTWGGMRTENVSNTVSFKLAPALGTDLQISGGAITATLYLRATSAPVGNLNFMVTEIKSTGEQVQVPSARIQSQVVLDKDFLPFTLGVGPIDYRFQKGSSIEISVQLEVKGTAYLAWDDPSTPSSVTIPTADLPDLGIRGPVHANVTTIDSQSQSVRIFQTEISTDRARMRLQANVTDSIGTYRLSGTTFAITEPNGTVVRIQPTQHKIDEYTAIYSVNTTLRTGSWQISFELRDNAGHTYTFSQRIWVTPFAQVRVTVVDSSRKALQNATVQVSYQQLRTWSSQTNATGSTTFVLPSSDVVGPLNLTVYWLGVPVSQPLLVGKEQTIAVVVVHTIDRTLHFTIYGLPVPLATVTALKDHTVAGQSITSYDGTVTIEGLPPGNYTFNIRYIFSEINITLPVDTTEPSTISLPLPHRTELAAALLVVASVALIGLDRRRRKTYAQDSSYFNQMTSGGLPETCFALITGNSGAGKSVLLETLAVEHLSKGASVYVTNTEYPSKIREGMSGLKTMTEDELKKIVFIDAYSAIGGTVSAERYSISSHTDLTGLGLQISKCLDETGPDTDVYVDSIGPLLADLRTSYVLSFVNSVAVKVKAKNGKLCATIGVTVDKSDLTKIEEVADCVIEMQLQESRHGQKRRLRIKKLRGKAYMDKWVNFRVESGKGIIFFTRTKPSRNNSKPVSNQN